MKLKKKKENKMSSWELIQTQTMIDNFEFDIDEETGEVLNIEELKSLIDEKDKLIEFVLAEAKNEIAYVEALKNEISNMRIVCYRLRTKLNQSRTLLQRFAMVKSLNRL